MSVMTDHLFIARKRTSLPTHLSSRTCDEAVIPTWPVDRPLPAAAVARALDLDRRQRVASVAASFG
jgi:hypothetical protein